MDPLVVLLSCWIVAQAPAGQAGDPMGDAKSEPGFLPPKATASPLADPPAASPLADPDPPADPPVTGELAPVRHKSPRNLAQTILSEALDPPEGASASGSALSLLEALRRSAGRAARPEVVKAYWSVSAATARKHIWQQSRDRLQRLVDSTSESESSGGTGLLAALAASKAQEREAALALQETQYLLGGLVRDAQSRPSCSDRPHVGGYRTEFEKLFAKRTPPANLRLIDHSLPLRHRCLELRAEAVRALREALEAAEAAHRQGSISSGELLGNLEAYREQRLAFIRELEQYNGQICDYAAGVSKTSTDTASFVALLIQTKASSTSKLVPKPRPDSAPATFVPPRDARPARGTPKNASRKEKSILRSSTERTADKRDRAVRPAKLQRPQTKTPAAPEDQGQTLLPGGSGDRSTEAVTHQVQYADESGSEPVVLRRFAGLSDLPPEKQAQQLAGLLYANRTNPLVVTIRQVSLNECLRGVTAANRRAVIVAYWAAAEQAARFSAAAVRHEQIDAVRFSPTSSDDDVSLNEFASRGKRFTAEADLEDARADLLSACFQLTMATSRPASDPWLWPGAVPTARKFELNAGRHTRPSPTHLPGIIAASYQLLEQRATAVVAADAARATSQGRLRDGRAHLIDVYRAIDAEHLETLRFLGTLTRYNLAHADYLLALAP